MGILGPVLDALCSFRDGVRAATRGHGKNDGIDGVLLLRLCDSLRDDALPTAGVRLEDGSGVIGGKSLWKLEDRSTLMREVQAKNTAAAAEEEERARRREVAARKIEEAALRYEIIVTV